MRKSNTKYLVILIILLCFIIGGTLSFESLARFSKKLSDVNKRVTVGEFNVEATGNFNETSEIKPGDTIGEDKITLTNSNDYPVEFTINLKAENENEKNLVNYLTLTIEKVEKTTTENHFKTTVGANDKKEVYTKIEWLVDDNTEIDYDSVKGASAKYTYNITAKQLKKETE